MKILILGATGMLGHKLMQKLSQKFELFGSVRGSAKKYTEHPLLHNMRLLGDITVENFDSIYHAINDTRPAVVINCIGILKQNASAKNPMSSILVNAYFPHQLANICRNACIRLIHISTDCVFSGCRGNYVENDFPDAEDLYGRTKILGEIDQEGSLTLRTSIIGRELETTHGLIEWFLSQEGKTIKGYKRAIFSGFTTQAFAEIIEKIIIEHKDLQGILHVASEPISKFDLLSLVNQIYGLKIQIEPDNEVVCNRSLDASRFNRTTGFTPSSWSDMIEQMYKDPTPYSDLRRSYAHR